MGISSCAFQSLYSQFKITTSTSTLGSSSARSTYASSVFFTRIDWKKGASSMFNEWEAASRSRIASSFGLVGSLRALISAAVSVAVIKLILGGIYIAPCASNDRNVVSDTFRTGGNT